MATEDLLEKLQQLLQQKQQLMQQVLLVSQQLVSADGELEKIQALLDARQEYMNKTDQLDEQINFVKQRIITDVGVGSWPDMEKLYPQAVANLDAMVTNIKELAMAAHQITQQSRQQAEAKLSQLQQEFKKLQSNKTGFTAYQHKRVQTSGYFLDKKK